MSEAARHREDFSPLAHVEAQAEAFETALASGRLHHAWLLTGPPGVGKAGFAYRAARRLLGAAPTPGFGPLGSAPEDRVSRLMAARAHPDFLVLQRATEDGKPRRNIPVDEARQLPEFFAKAPALAPHRVAVIDSVDDLNVNAANALLKTLEEPPPRGVLLLVSHSPGRLLDTIRSRCRRLSFPPWPPEAIAERLMHGAALDSAEAMRLARSAGGSPGRALARALGAASSVEAVAQAVLDALPASDPAQLLKITEGFRGGEGAERFSTLIEALAEGVRARLLAASEAAAGAVWSEAWRRLVALPGEVEALNLDRSDAFFTAVAELRAAARSQPLPC